MTQPDEREGLGMAVARLLLILAVLNLLFLLTELGVNVLKTAVS